MKIGRYAGLPTRRNKPKKSLLQDALPPSPPKKKALLIGITYSNAAAAPGFAALQGPHGDVEDMRGLLMNQYGYKAEDIVTLLDDGVCVQPTRTNILSAIDDLVHGARRGDRFFFHYCGHTTQVESKSNSEEDGMDECLVPLDGEVNQIKDNELRSRLVNPLPVGSNLVAVFDSCHSASLLDLAHFRCNRVYVPWISKGRRRSDELWNAVVRKHAMPLLPLSKPATPVSSPPSSRTHTRADLSAAPTARSPLAPPIHTAGVDGTQFKTKTAPRPTRRATRELRELRQLNQLLKSVPPSEPSAAPMQGTPAALPVIEDEVVPTRPSSPEPVTATVGTPVVTTRRIYETVRTSDKQVRAWCTEVGSLEVDVPRAGNDDDADVSPVLTRAGTEGDLLRMNRGRRKLLKDSEDQPEQKPGDSMARGRRKRASLPLPLGPLRPMSLVRALAPAPAPAPTTEGRQRRTTVTRARAVSVTVREHELEVRVEAEKENAPAPAPAPVAAVTQPGVRPSLKLDFSPMQGRPASWFDEDGVNRECESPAAVWPCTGWSCRDPAHAHQHDDGEEKADVISLASCKDHQLSWEDSNGGSMTRELVRILDQDPHPTLRSLVTRVSHALHRMSLERHLDTRRYKRELKRYQEWERKHQGRQSRPHTRAGAAAPGRARTQEDAGATAGSSSAATIADAPPSGSVSRASTLSPETPSGSSSTAQLPDATTGSKQRAPPLRPPTKAKSAGFVSELDMDSFQDPQVSSHRPLNMDQAWSM